MSLTQACCDTPSVEAHWHNKGEFKALDGSEFQTYISGPKDAKNGVVFVFDIFGRHPTTYRFIDNIAMKGLRVSAPDFFPQGGIPPHYMGDMSKVMGWLGENGDYEKNHIGAGIKAAARDLLASGCTSVSIMGQCWGARVSIFAASEPDSPFLAAGGPHPSFTNGELLKNLNCPLILLPSKDENEADMASCAEVMAAKNLAFPSFQKTFPTMHHGWTGGRGDWSVPEQRACGEEAAAILGDYFNKVAAAHAAKL